MIVSAAQPTTISVMNDIVMSSAVPISKPARLISFVYDINTIIMAAMIEANPIVGAMLATVLCFIQRTKPTARARSPSVMKMIALIK